MTTRTSKAPAKAAPAKASAKGRGTVQAFSFGDPEPVLSRRELLDHIECWRNDRWYEPPVSLAGLARTYLAAPHHSSAIMVKVNLLSESFIPHRLLSRKAFNAWVLDYLVMANGYLERRDSVGGDPLRLERAVAKWTRRGVEDGRFFFLNNGAMGWGGQDAHEFKPGSVFQLAEPDLNQEIYGVPSYLSALQSALLNESATIFRRRYYQNGSHAGFILYSTDQQLAGEDVDTLRQALRDSKGPGNFRNVFLHAPGGKKDGLQLIPVSEVAARDEFMGIKNTSRDDILAAHRVPPQLVGVVPQGSAGFGDAAKARDVFFMNEILPLQEKTKEVNDWAGEEVVAYRPFEPISGQQPASNDNGGGGSVAA